jgi:signal transduction histidine kinase
MGLGLSVCKRIIEALGSGISVETKVGVGTTILVRVPLQETIPDQMREQLVSIQDACP